MKQQGQAWEMTSSSQNTTLVPAAVTSGKPTNMYREGQFHFGFLKLLGKMGFLQRVGLMGKYTRKIIITQHHLEVLKRSTTVW